MISSSLHFSELAFLNKAVLKCFCSAVSGWFQTLIFHGLTVSEWCHKRVTCGFFCHLWQVGLLDEEKVLPLGREITAVGTLSVSLDGTPVIKPSGCLPVFLTDLTRDQLLLDLANGRHVLFWMGIAATIVATGVLGYALIKYVQTDPSRDFSLSKENFQVLRKIFLHVYCVDCLHSATSSRFHVVMLHTCQF
jgi:hypothetical protein